MFATRRSTAAFLVFTVTAFALTACGKKNRPTAGGGDSNPRPPAAKDGTPFLQGTKELPARMEWNRDFVSNKGGTIAFRVTSTAPFSVSIITDKGRQALMGKGPFDKSDVLFTTNAKPPEYKGRVTVPPGRSWFIIENQSDGPVTMALECNEVK